MTEPENKEAANASLSRREALIRLLRVAWVSAGAAGFGVWLSQRSSRPELAIASNVKRGHKVAADPALPEMAIITGEDPAPLARTALAELGGMKRFVSRGDIVLVKPTDGIALPNRLQIPIQRWSQKLSGNALIQERSKSS
jgi:hypothetical protein